MGMTTKSPVALLRTTFALATASLPPYSCGKSRHDFTQAQLFSILVLRQFLKTDYRGVIKHLEDCAEMRQVISLSKLPHFTTVQKAEQRLLKKSTSSVCSPLS
jgi:hypothetical protein